MRRPRLLVLSSWVVATALATVVSAAGVSIVTKDVTSDHGPALAAADVVALLSAGTEADDLVVEAAPTAPETTSPPAETAATNPPESSPPPSRPTTTAPPSPSVNATFGTRGGVISVSCRGEIVSLLSARPDNAFQVQVRESGPELAVVRFASGGSQDGKLAVACAAGAPTLVDERPATPADPAAAHRERDGKSSGDKHWDGRDSDSTSYEGDRDRDHDRGSREHGSDEGQRGSSGWQGGDRSDHPSR